MVILFNIGKNLEVIIVIFININKGKINKKEGNKFKVLVNLIYY